VAKSVGKSTEFTEKDFRLLLRKLLGLKSEIRNLAKLL
jgi:hypothetical protein